MEEIAHGIDEDLPRGLPAERLPELFRDKADVEPLFKGVSWNATKALRESLGIAILAARADLRAATHRIPGRVGPFDLGLFAHDDAPTLIKKYSTVSLFILLDMVHVTA
jgi:hypothetical protein